MTIDCTSLQQRRNLKSSLSSGEQESLAASEEWHIQSKCVGCYVRHVSISGQYVLMCTSCAVFKEIRDLFYKDDISTRAPLRVPNRALPKPNQKRLEFLAGFVRRHKILTLRGNHNAFAETYELIPHSFESMRLQIVLVADRSTD